jgi:hypothetical protein
MKGWWSGSKCRPWVQTPVLQKIKEKKKKEKGRQEVSMTEGGAEEGTVCSSVRRER